MTKIFGPISVGFGVVLALGGAIALVPLSIAIGAGLIALGGILSFLNKGGNKPGKNQVIKECA